MTKKQFVQQVIIRSLPELERLSSAVTYAESLWENLSQLGYGTVTKQQPRETINWYKKLNPHQRKWFDIFWNNFNHKHDRNSAAMEWHKLGELDNAAYKKIAEAAKKESLRPIAKGLSRKMAQGWLSGYRYEDQTPTVNTERKKNNTRLTSLIGELNAVKKLNEASPHDSLTKQIKALEQAVRDERARLHSS